MKKNKKFTMFFGALLFCFTAAACGTAGQEDALVMTDMTPTSAPVREDALVMPDMTPTSAPVREDALVMPDMTPTSAPVQEETVVTEKGIVISEENFGDVRF